MDNEDIIKLIQSQVSELSFLDRIPDRSSLNKQKLQEIINKLGIKMLTPSIVEEIIGDLAFDEVLEKTKHDDPKSSGNRKFSELPSVDSFSVATNCYTLLSKIPQEYTFVFKLPKFDKKFSPINFGHGIDLLIIDDNNLSNYVSDKSKMKEFYSLLSDIRRRRSNLLKGDVILTIKGNGYVGKYGTIKINITEDPLYIFKVIVGVYSSLKIIHRNNDKNYLQPITAYCYEVFNANNELIRTISESTEDADYIFNKEFDPIKFELSELDKLIKKRYTEFEYANLIIKNLFTVVRFAGGKTDDKLIKKQLMIKNALYWFYEALKTNQDHIKAVYITTAFDSILNSKGKEDTKEYKASMIANVIAKDVLEADGIVKGICHLYSLRNEIVHGERAVYSLDKYNDKSDSQSVVYEGLWYLAQFLGNRVYFVNNGLAKVIGIIQNAKQQVKSTASKENNVT